MMSQPDNGLPLDVSESKKKWCKAISASLAVLCCIGGFVIAYYMFEKAKLSPDTLRFIYEMLVASFITLVMAFFTAFWMIFSPSKKWKLAIVGLAITSVATLSQWSKSSSTLDNQICYADPQQIAAMQKGILTKGCRHEDEEDSGIGNDIAASCFFLLFLIQCTCLITFTALHWFCSERRNDLTESDVGRGESEEQASGVSDIPLDDPPATSSSFKAESDADLLKYFNVASKVDRFDCHIALKYLDKYQTTNSVEEHVPQRKQGLQRREFKKGDILFEKSSPATINDGEPVSDSQNIESC